MNVRYLLSDAALSLQVLCGLSFVVLCLRFGWLAIEHGGAAFPDPPAGALGPPRRPGLPQLSSPDDILNQLKETLEQTQAQTSLPPSESAPDAPRLRQIVVDFGPNRSEVYLNGRNVGRTPFAGQISCRDGDAIRIDVVPPDGLPQSRSGVCRGDSVGARSPEEPEEPAHLPHEPLQGQ